MSRYKSTLLGFMSWLILGSTLIKAQSVESFIKMAHDNNPGLEALRLNYQAAQLKSKQVSDYPDPKVNVALGVLPIETRLGSQRFRMGISQEIPWKGLLNAKSDVASAKAETMAYLDESIEIDIELYIRNAYSTLGYIEKRINTIGEKFKVLDAMEELAKSSIRSGKGKLSNILMIERSRLALENDLQILSQQRAQPTIIINRWSGRELNEVIIVEQQAIVNNAKSELINFAMAMHPQIRTFENQISASVVESELTRLGSKPKVSVGIEYAWISQRDGIEIANNGRDAIMPMASISIPFHTGRFDAKRQEEKMKQEAMRAKISDMQSLFKSEIAKAYAQIETADLTITKMNTLRKITTETIQLMRTEYASEGTRFEELLRLELDLIDYQLSIVDAHYQRELSQATLMKYQN